MGNHDIGYGSDVISFIYSFIHYIFTFFVITPLQIDEDNLERFINAFGKVDDIIIIEDHLIGIVNSMNLDPSSYEVYSFYSLLFILLFTFIFRSFSLSVVVLVF